MEKKLRDTDREGHLLPRSRHCLELDLWLVEQVTQTVMIKGETRKNFTGQKIVMTKTKMIGGPLETSDTNELKNNTHKIISM